MNIILTMAGNGTRVKDFSDQPKPFIEIDGKSLLELSLFGLPLNGNRLILVTTGLEYRQLVNTISFLPELDFADVEIVILEERTSGQAETALLGMVSVENNEPVLISNCDTFFTDNFPKELPYGGLIGTFEGSSPNYSYVKVENGLVVETAEKVVISSRASAGLYYFSSKELFKRAYYGTEFQGEKYIAPMYNYLINAGIPVGEFPINVVIPLGTTEELLAAKADSGILKKYL